MNAAAPGERSEAALLDAKVAQAASEWFARLSSGVVSDADRHAWQQWRMACAEHERAWQRVESVSHRFGLLRPAAGMAALGRQPASRERRQALKSIVLVATVGGAGWLSYRHTPWRDGPADYRTAIGERREVTLADGTCLMLNTRSAVNVRFDAGERRVDLLHGEIHIATAQDPQGRPLIIDTRFGRLQPIGTRFTVRQDDALVRVVVLEGAVQVRPKGAGDNASALRVVRAADTLRLDANGVADSAPSHESADAWTHGVLLADGMTLGEFVAELSRYRAGRLHCDSQVSGLRLSGAFPLDDTDRALVAATRALPVRIESFTRFWITVRPA